MEHTPGGESQRLVLQALALDPFGCGSYTDFIFLLGFCFGMHICMYLCLTYRHKICYTCTLIYKNTYVVMSYSRTISLSSNSLKMNLLSCLLSSLVTLHGDFNLVAAEMWRKEPSNLYYTSCFESKPLIYHPKEL